MPDIRAVDNVLPTDAHEAVYKFLNKGPWEWEWRSNPDDNTPFRFFHRHFAGAQYADHHEQQSDCYRELASYPLLERLWQALSAETLKGHKVVRCYANGLPYGADGTLHTDCVHPQGYTVIYYPNPVWYPNWGGETCFFNADKTDLIAACYPRPNRMVIFRGTIPHVARGVSRICPVMRITLMFKTEARHEP